MPAGVERLDLVSPPRGPDEVVVMVVGKGGLGGSGTARLGQTLSGVLGRRGCRPARRETAQRKHR